MGDLGNQQGEEFTILAAIKVALNAANELLGDLLVQGGATLTCKEAKAVTNGLTNADLWIL